MKLHEIQANRIVEQIRRLDFAFFLESGIDETSARTTQPKGSRTRVTFAVKHGTDVVKQAIEADITSLEITLEVSDLYTVKATYANSKEQQIERVSVFELIEVLWAIFYRHEDDAKIAAWRKEFLSSQLC